MWVIISGILGILGFAISAINIISYFHSRRIHLEITFLEFAYRDYIDSQKRIIVHYRATNNSQLPISISNIRLNIGENFYYEDYNMHEILSYCKRSGKEIVERISTYNEHLPINLDCLQSHSGYLVFVIPADNLPNLDKGLTFQIYTSRGTESKRIFLQNQSQKLP